MAQGDSHPPTLTSYHSFLSSLSIVRYMSFPISLSLFVPFIPFPWDTPLGQPKGEHGHMTHCLPAHEHAVSMLATSLKHQRAEFSASGLSCLLEEPAAPDQGEDRELKEGWIWSQSFQPKAWDLFYGYPGLTTNTE